MEEGIAEIKRRCNEAPKEVDLAFILYRGCRVSFGHKNVELWSFSIQCHDKKFANDYHKVPTLECKMLISPVLIILQQYFAT